MQLRYNKRGQLVTRGFNGDVEAYVDTKKDVRIDALSKADINHNTKVELEQKLMVLRNKKVQQIKERNKELEFEKTMAMQKIEHDKQKQLKRLANSTNLQLIRQLHKPVMEQMQNAVMGSRTMLSNNPFMSREFDMPAEVLKTPSLRISKDFNSQDVIFESEDDDTSDSDSYNTSFTNLDQFLKNESKTKTQKRRKTNKKKAAVIATAVQFQHPLLKLTPQQAQAMGFSFSLPKISLPSISLPKISVPTIKQIVGGISSGVNSVVKAVTNPPPVRLPTISEVGKMVGGYMEITNPAWVADKALKTIPVVKDAYREVDEFSGGLFSDFNNLNTLHTRAIKGEPISKADILSAVMLCAKVGLIVASGGSAAAYIGAASSQLKKGPLGETEWGRTLLAAGEIAGLAYASGEAVTNVVATKAKDEATNKVVAESTKKAGVGGTILAVAATGTLKNPEQSFVTNTYQALQIEAKDQAVKEFEKQTGIPASLAEDLVKGGVPTKAKINAAIQQNVNRSIDDLKSEITNIKARVTNAPTTAQAIMKARSEYLTDVVTNREKYAKELQDKAIAEVDKATPRITEIGKKYDAMVINEQTIANQALELRKKALEAVDQAVKDELVKQAEALEAKLLELIAGRKKEEPAIKAELEGAVKTANEAIYRSVAAEYGARFDMKGFVTTTALVALGGLAAFAMFNSGSEA